MPKKRTKGKKTKATKTTVTQKVAIKKGMCKYCNEEYVYADDPDTHQGCHKLDCLLKYVADLKGASPTVAATTGAAPPRTPVPSGSDQTGPPVAKKRRTDDQPSEVIATPAGAVRATRTATGALERIPSYQA